MTLRKTLIKITCIMIFSVFLFESCSIKKEVNNNNASNGFQLKISKLEIKEQNFLSLILSTKKDFKDKYKDNPNVIIVELWSDGTLSEFDIENKMYLYTDKTEKNTLDEIFIGGTIIENTLVLLKGNNKSLEMFKDYIILENKEMFFDINYGGNINSCMKKFKISDKAFLLKDSYCAFDIHTK